jgi:hypothetical protein
MAVFQICDTYDSAENLKSIATEPVVYRVLKGKFSIMTRSFSSISSIKNQPLVGKLICIQLMAS